MATFTTKHYKAIAEIIADQGFAGNNMDDRGRHEHSASIRTMDGLVDNFIHAFQNDNPNFKEHLFRKACGYENE